jgi:pimeloyl-ACP methyl ester carboxylesterase
MTARLDVEFVSGDATCSAWLYLPKAQEPAPVIVMAHGFGGIREMRLDAYAERFCAAGYACLVFDYRHFGASGGQPRQLLDVDHQLADWSAAVAFARGRADIDPSRIVLWGTSFSGGHVITTAAREAGIAAVIAQCPFTDGLISVLAMSPQAAVKAGARAIADVIADRLGKEPVMVPVVGAPHSTAMMTAPDALPAMQALVPDGVVWHNEVAARIALRVLTYRPRRDLARVGSPLLLCVCEADSVTPANATLRHAQKAPHGEVRLYPEGHFDIYLGEPFERLVADQIDFLHTYVPVPTVSANNTVASLKEIAQ